MNKNSVVLYKNQPAVVTDIDGEKYVIKFCVQPATSTGKKAVYSEQKVREKDVVLLHEGPVSSLEKVLEYKNEAFNSQLKEVYELLSADITENSEPAAYSMEDIADLAFGKLEADSSWCFYSTLVASKEFALVADELKSNKIVPDVNVIVSLPSPLLKM